MKETVKWKCFLVILAIFHAVESEILIEDSENKGEFQFDVF